MKVGLIHALTYSVRPIEKEFQKLSPETELVHVMDTELLNLLQQQKSLTPEIIRRFSKLIHLVSEANVDCIQLTCSAFNDITTILQPLSEVKMFRSDEAMLDRALKYEKIGFISTVNETPPVLLNYLQSKKQDVNVKSMVNSEALQCLFQGDLEVHDHLIQDMMKKMEKDVDVIVLTQYSLAHIAGQVDISIPIITGPKESAKRCIEYMRKNNQL